MPVKDAAGDLLATAIPKVTIVKHARYLPEDTSGDASSEVDILARIEKNLRAAPLAGFVAEGSAPFGAMSNSVDAALKRATFSGMPVVKVGRGNAGGFVDADARSAGDRRQQSHRDQGAAAVDGLLDEVWLLAAGGRSGETDRGGNRGDQSEVETVSGNFRYALIWTVTRRS